MFVRVVVCHDVVSARRGSHGPRVRQDPRLAVVDAVPVGCTESRYYGNSLSVYECCNALCIYIIQLFAKLVCLPF